MPSLAGVAGEGYLAPGQGGELGVQAGLIALDGEQVVRAAPGQVRSSRLGLTWANGGWVGGCPQVKRTVPTFALAG